VAHYRAISAVGEAILGILEAACPQSDFPNADFYLHQVKDFQSPEITEGISLYLYRTHLNTNRRSLPPRIDPLGRRYRASLPLDLYYLLTPWANTAKRQHLILGWAMLTLHETPVLNANLLNRKDPDTFLPNEAIEIVCDNLSLQDMSFAIEPIKPHAQFSVGYVARMVIIDSQVELGEFDPVQVREFEMQKM
jgi:Pvc16 N-terminal domain